MSFPNSQVSYIYSFSDMSNDYDVTTYTPTGATVVSSTGK
jgi:hypothetical protein